MVGGGIVGLWCAYRAADRGARVALFEAGALGGGASGGLLGALMPHQPVGWNAKKQLQLDGLLALPGLVRALEAETGLACGYRRCGRIMPIAHADKRRTSEGWARGAYDLWPDNATWRLLETPDHPDWPRADAGSHGFNRDTLSARLAPRGLIAALVAACRARGVDLRPHTPVRALAADGSLRTADGTRHTPARLIVTAGWRGFELLKPLWPTSGGTGVKGQAALLAPPRPLDPARPIVYDSGVYAIVHDDGRVAVGSTSETEFSAPDTTDARLDDVIERARALCPELAQARVVERWAGVRPRAGRTAPVFGPLPDAPAIVVATGGLKITFAIAHLMARAAVDHALDGETSPALAAFAPVGATQRA